MILGLDLSSRETFPSGYALLSLNREIVDYGHFRVNSEIISYVLVKKPDLISIDAPLSLGEGGFRNCEKLLLKAGYKVFPTTIKWMRELALRGMFIANTLRKQGYRVIETHPTSSLRACGFKGNIKSKSTVISFIKEKWGVEIPKNISRHIVDAILAALAGYSYVIGEAIIFRSDDCEIVLASIK